MTELLIISILIEHYCQWCFLWNGLLSNEWWGLSEIPS